eukprot:3669340-Rhodomonas_salina.1
MQHNRISEIPCALSKLRSLWRVPPLLRAPYEMSGTGIEYAPTGRLVLTSGMRLRDIWYCRVRTCEILGAYPMLVPDTP